MVNLGAVNFTDLTLEQLRSLTYGNAAANCISGSDGENALFPGEVFAVHTWRRKLCEGHRHKPLGP
jgi:hypothetical protein